MDGYQQQAGWAQDVLEASVAMWTPLASPQKSAAPRSWYRAPAPDPFDLGAWGMPTPFQSLGGSYGVGSWFNPWSNFASPFATSLTPTAFQIPWSTIASVASVMAAVQPSSQSGWIPGLPVSRPTVSPVASWEAMMWPMVQLNALAAVATVSTVFSSYRSDSGHAVAHIIHGTEKAAEPKTTALDFFRWPGFTVH